MIDKDKELTVLSLFDGMSCGRIALEELKIPVKKYYASEIDKYAIQQSSLNFPDIVHLGSVTGVDVSKLEHIDLMIGGSPCFVAGTKIICESGIKNIEDITCEDMVLTHTGKYQRVLATGGDHKPTVELRSQGMIRTITTDNHPYYVRSMSREWDNNKRSSYRYFSEPYWKSVSEIVTGDFVGMPLITKEENPLGITVEEAFIIGRYIADGHTRKDYRKSENRPSDRHWQLILTVGDKKVDFFKRMVKENNFSCYRHTQSTHRIVFSSKRLVDIVEANCGCGSENKHIGLMLLNLPKLHLESLIDGYLYGDGYEFSDKKYSITTISPQLIITLGLAIFKVYGVGVSCGTHIPSKQKMLCGRLVNQKPQHILRFSKKLVKQAKFKIINDICWFPVKSIKSTNRTERVYNLEIETDNSYTANGFIVHNCQSFSFAGKRKGMATKCEIEILSLEHYLELKENNFEFEGQSYLFWEYMRILNDIRKYNPDVKFLLENVEMGKKWESVLTKAIGVPGIHINAALVSAQNRRRIYWTNIGTQTIGEFRQVVSFIEQPVDRGILLRDILEPEVDEKYYLTQTALDYINRGKERNRDRVNLATEEEKSTCLTQNYHRGVHNQGETYICVRMVGRNPENPSDRTAGSPTVQRLEPCSDVGKTNCLTTVGKDNLILAGNLAGGKWDKIHESSRRVYSAEGKSPTVLNMGGGNQHPKIVDDERLLYQKPHGYNSGGFVIDGKTPYLTKSSWEQNNLLITSRVRRLTPTECARLQTIPDWYRWSVSNTQQYRMLGNGWCVEVIKYIFSYLYKTPEPKIIDSEELYDGIF